MSEDQLSRLSLSRCEAYFENVSNKAKMDGLFGYYTQEGSLADLSVSIERAAFDLVNGNSSDHFFVLYLTDYLAQCVFCLAYRAAKNKLEFDDRLIRDFCITVVEYSRVSQHLEDPDKSVRIHELEPRALIDQIYILCHLDLVNVIQSDRYDYAHVYQVCARIAAHIVHLADHCKKAVGPVTPGSEPVQKTNEQPVEKPRFYSVCRPNPASVHNAPLARKEPMSPEQTAPGPSEPEIRRECEKLADLLCQKNRQYGDAALNPIRIFSKASAVEQLFCRIDDKITRLKNQQPDDTEDTVTDLLGYLVLLKIAQRRAVKSREVLKP